MAERGENAGVRDAKVALQFFGGESRVARKQALISPCRAADVVQEQLFNEGHGKSIYGSGREPVGGSRKQTLYPQSIIYNRAFPT
jgi:hypothetical protein